MSLWEPPNLAGMRVSYDRGSLREEQLAASPLQQFGLWWQEALESGLPEPNAMTLATVDATGAPTARIVLLKGVDSRGFRFFTNYSSRKARAIEADPRVALVLPWFAMHRQVTILGTAEKLDSAESAEYFSSRPRDSQLAAWASWQSEALEDRAGLEERLAELQQRWPEGSAVPVPDFWGGYLVRPTSVEFWHGRESRLHDRLRYEAVTSPAPMHDPEAWQVQRYAP